MYLVQIYQGIGDHLSQRHFLKRLPEFKEDVVVRTPWPQLLWDIPNIKLATIDTMLRCQEKNMLAQPKDVWTFAHKKWPVDLTIGYDDRHLAAGLTMAQSFAKKIKEDSGIAIDDYSLELPLKPEWVERAKQIVNGRKIVIVRPPTVRREWTASSRNPQKGLMQKVLNKLPTNWVKIGVSYNQNIEETQVEQLRFDEEYLEGQLPIEIVAALMQQAELVVAPVGFATLMGIAVKAKLFTLFGGHVASSHIFDKRMDLSRNYFVEPSPPCDCFNLQHTSCNLAIPDSEIDRVLTNAIRYT